MKAVAILLVGVSLHVKAQTFSEWFQQNKTQLKYLRQQIEALQAYSQTVQQGYALAERLTDSIWVIKAGDLGLHSVYIGDLSKVRPALATVYSESAALYEQIKAVSPTLADLQGYADRLMNWQYLLLSDGRLQLTDAQRQQALSNNEAALYDLLTDVLNIRNALNFQK